MNISKDGDCTDFLGNVFQCLTIHREREKKISVFLYVQVPTGSVGNSGNAFLCVLWGVRTTLTMALIEERLTV